jgi:Holliday junction DNA helicase RuvA
MYSYIKGMVKSIRENHLIVDNNSIGYSINTSANTLKDCAINDQVTIYTHLYVREDIITLYGFASPEELGLFEILIRISGVGPKAALSILSLADVSTIKYSIFIGDHKFISKASGIGKRTAEKIILELKDKIKDEFAGITMDPGLTDSVTSYDTVTDALVSLGFTLGEARSVLKNIDKTGKTEDEIIKLALKKIGN